MSGFDRGGIDASPRAQPPLMQLSRTRVALAAVGLSSVPILLLTIAQDGWSIAATGAFWRDQLGVHARTVLCIPALILADGVCPPRLWRIVDHFVAAGLVGGRPGFDAAVAAARRGFSSRAALLVVVLLAYAVTFAVVASLPPVAVPNWHQAAGSSGPTPVHPVRFSPAGWWHIAVSMPIVLTLVFGWLWRFGVWCLLLVRIARCDLHTVSSHPDRTAGLGFLGGSLRALGPVALGFSAVAASRSLQVLAETGTIPIAQIYFDVGYVGFLVMLFVAPLTVFTPTLVVASRRGSLAYGSLAQKMGESLEERWLTRGGGARLDADALREPDFSATIDLYSIVANARGVRLVPIGRRDLLQLAGALAVPFLPIVLALVPIAVIWPQVKGLIF